MTMSTVADEPAPFTTQVPPPPVYSSDGRFWWDGQRWILVMPQTDSRAPRVGDGLGREIFEIILLAAVAALVGGATAAAFLSDSTSSPVQWLPLLLVVVAVVGYRVVQARKKQAES
jgi:hypothetical protein